MKTGDNLLVIDRKDKEVLGQTGTKFIWFSIPFYFRHFVRKNGLIVFSNEF